jgi:hypothetical protein
MAHVAREATSLIHSKDALEDRARKAGLSEEETQAILAGNVNSLAQLAFAMCPPGQAPSEQDVRTFYDGRVAVNLGTITATKLLVFEAHTMVVANIKNEISRKDDAHAASTLPSAERDRRIKDQKEKLRGLRLKGDEECAFSTLLKKDTLTYLHPERFLTRRAELQQKKPARELVLDQNALTVRDKQPEATCSTRTELEVVQAMRRRALAFDLIGLCPYTM